MLTTIFNEECVSGSKSHFDDEMFDLTICDPPFGIGEGDFDKMYNRKEDNVLCGYQEAPQDYEQFSYDWLAEVKRTLKQNGSLYVVSGWTNLRHILNAMAKLELNVINHIIWKYNFGVNTSKKYVSSHYHIIYATKSKKSKPTFNTEVRFSKKDKKDNHSLLYADLEDVWIINKEYQRGAIKNQNKLPDELIKKMIQYSSNKGDKVCDMFLGNFTTAKVARQMERLPYGFEINKVSYERWQIAENPRGGDI